MAEIFINPCFYFFTFSTFLGIFSPLLTKYSVCRVIFLFGFFFHGFVHAQSCDSSNECLLESRYKNDSVVCDITPFNTNNPPCYGHWSKFDDCSCVNPDARISSVGATYWCNLDSNWDEALYELDCYDPCYTDAGYNVIAVDPNGDSTNVIQDGDYVVYSCPENYTSVGTAKVTCNDGVWEDHDIFECNADCSLPIGYIFSEESFARITDGTNVAIECEKGLNTDTVVSECSNGTIEVDSCIYATTPSNADTTESSRTTETLTTEIAPEVTTDVTTPSELRSTAATPPLPSTEVTKDVTTLYKSQSTVASSDIYSSEATTGIFTDDKSSTVTTKRLHTTYVATSSERQSTFEMSPLYSTDVTTPSKSHSTVVSTPLSSTPVTTDITNDVSTSLDTTDTTTVEFSSTTPTPSIITGLSKATFSNLKEER
ncbi:uncharacterized protein [Apostichopus japonicus]|uniref:uncharacterized protein n=1 Tax=Stichopus japonicus TaxID=307972 RepID=UPI003AB454A7